MKHLYLILTHTGTTLSKIIKSYTKDEFSHVSIALDIELKEMYSFGRLHPSNPFLAGFVHEQVNEGTFKRFYNTKAKVYSLEVTEEQYEKVKEKIEKMKQEKYSFNILGLIAVGLHKKIRKEHSFYCAEFVKYVMEQAGIELSLPELVKPEDFKKIEGMKEIYSGFFRKYKIPQRKIANLLSKRIVNV